MEKIYRLCTFLARELEKLRNKRKFAISVFVISEFYCIWYIYKWYGKHIPLHYENKTGIPDPRSKTFLISLHTLPKHFLWRRSSGGVVVKLMACGARGLSGVQFPVLPLRFQRLVISYILSRYERSLKWRKSSKQPTNNLFVEDGYHSLGMGRKTMVVLPIIWVWI